MQIGVFVGGRSTRMGTPKGLLITPTGETLLARTLRIASAVGEVVVVGDSPYDVASLGDDPPGIGPLGGLAALLSRGPAIALACDMPYFEEEHLRLLLASEGLIVAPRRNGLWEPLFARYSLEVLPLVRAMIARGEHSLQGLLRTRATAIEIDPHALEDWDSPEDLPR